MHAIPRANGGPLDPGRQSGHRDPRADSSWRECADQRGCASRERLSGSRPVRDEELSTLVSDAIRAALNDQVPSGNKIVEVGDQANHVWQAFPGRDTCSSALQQLDMGWYELHRRCSDGSPCAVEIRGQFGHGPTLCKRLREHVSPTSHCLFATEQNQPTPTSAQNWCPSSAKSASDRKEIQLTDQPMLNRAVHLQLGMLNLRGCRDQLRRGCRWRPESPFITELARQGHRL